MTFQESIKVCFAKYADFTGRAIRSEYWWFALFTLLVSLVLSRVISEALAGLFNLAVLLPSLAVGARRLHDTGRTGWWQLLLFIPVIGWIVLLVFFAQDSRPGLTSA